MEKTQRSDLLLCLSMMCVCVCVCVRVGWGVCRVCGSEKKSQEKSKIHSTERIYVCVCVCVCVCTQSSQTFCDPMDYSPSGYSIYGIFQATMLEQDVISYYRGSSPPRVQTHVSCIGRWILYHCATCEALYIYIYGSPINIYIYIYVDLQDVA